MRTKSKALIEDIERFVNQFTDKYGISPTMQEVADGVGSSRPTVCRYVSQMCADGILDFSGYRTMTTTKTRVAANRVPVLGRVSCGFRNTQRKTLRNTYGFLLRCLGKEIFFFFMPAANL